MTTISSETTYFDPKSAVYSGYGAEYSELIDAKNEIQVKFAELRRERTGLHGRVSIFLNYHILAYDTFNLGKREDRLRLTNEAYKTLLERNSELNVIYPVETMRHMVNILCQSIPDEWESQAIKISLIDDIEPSPLRFPLAPYILEGGGTIFFAPPGSGKSYLLHAMALAIATEHQGLWRTARAPVVFINLERSENTVAIRDFALRRAMKIEGRSPVKYVHARGASLRQLAKHLSKHSKENPGTVAILDSLSRAGMGSLVEAEGANAFIDTMNDCFVTWAAIGHTPKSADSQGQGSSLYGSVHFIAGADILVRITSSHAGMGGSKALGLKLEMVKANDIRLYPAEHMALDFSVENAPITGIRASDPMEFPDLTMAEE